MTDKQIIDEVDVSKCKYNNNGWCLLSESCDAIRYRSCGDMTLFDCYYRNWQRKEQECEELKKEVQQALKKNAENYHTSCTLQKQLNQLKQALKEIKEILNFYANSKIGEKQGNGTYKILLNGGCILNYDPKPAIEALKKISEVLDD